MLGLSSTAVRQAASRNPSISPHYSKEAAQQSPAQKSAAHQIIPPLTIFITHLASSRQQDTTPGIMKTIAALTTVSTMLATVIHATEIADEHRMLAESFVSPGDKNYVVSLRLGSETYFSGALITKKHVLTSARYIGWVDTAVVGENTGDKVATGESGCD